MKDYDEASYCPKCHNDDIASQYVDKNGNNLTDNDWERDEHIRRRCKRCGFKWNELPLDISAARAALEKNDD